MSISWKDTFVPTLSLFTSAGTLICCALPALLVSIGMGAAVAGLVSNVPQLIWLSEHKVWVFAVSGSMLLIASYMQYLQRNAPCPADPKQAKACGRLRLISTAITIFSIGIYLIGFFFAFLVKYFI